MEPLFLEISNDQPVSEVESLCMECNKNGTTRMMFTKIPHFKEIYISSFECLHCGNRNNSVEFCHSISEKGIRISLRAKDHSDLNRQVVVSEFCNISIDEISLEIPPIANRTILTTVEGILDKCLDDMNQILEINKDADDSFLQRISSIAEAVKKYRNNEESFTLLFVDPSGNSYIQKYSEPVDPSLTIECYERDPEEMKKFGFIAENAPNAELDNRVNVFSSACTNCHVHCDTRMMTLDIPYFKEILIMSTKCEACGYTSNEVKYGGAIPEKGKKITFLLQDESDLSRDFLKSDSCSLDIPEIDLHLSYGTLGCQFTTIEGILMDIHGELEEKIPFAVGDSADKASSNRIKELADSVKLISQGKMKCTIILDDPLANSYIQNIYAPDPDPAMKIESYERSFEQNESFGLNDMKVAE